MSTRAIPCDQCNGVASIMAGRVAFPHEKGAHPETWLVCWECRRRAKFGAPWRDVTWHRIPKAQKKTDAPSWQKHTPYHWQTIIDGDILDYWPTKKKFRWRGETATGDVDAFIRKNTP